MKKFILFIIFLLILVFFAGILAWSNRAGIASHYLSKALNGVPVSIEKIEYDKPILTIDDFHIGNPKGSKTKTAFKSDAIKVDATMDQIRGEVMTIEEIEISDVLVGLEFYNALKTKTNWGYILKSSAKEKKKGGKEKDYLIRKLTLRNLTIQTTDHQGKTTNYPTIAKMEFKNISNKSGFPIDEIEKAIFDIMLQKALKEYGIKALEQTLEKFAPGGAPQLPGLFGN